MTIIRVIDTETTGTDPEFSKVIEIASIDINDDPNELTFENPMQTLVSIGDSEIPPESSAIHHYVKEDLVGAPPYEEAIKQFYGADVYVAHNMKFDQDFLPRDFVPKICTMKCAIRLWDDCDSYGNQPLRYHFKLLNPLGIKREDINPHKALSDVITTGAIFKEIMQNPFVNLEQLIEWTEEPQLMKKFNFGKHRGELLTEVEDGYLHWMMVKGDFDHDTLWNVENEINRRRDAGQWTP